MLLVAWETSVNALPLEHQPNLERWAYRLGTFAGLDGRYGLVWPDIRDREHDLVRALMMRVTYAHRLAAQHPRDRALQYQAWLFIDTHLDLLVLIMEKGGTAAATDAVLYPQLDRVYPLPHRVRCAWLAPTTPKPTAGTLCRGTARHGPLPGPRRPGHGLG